MRRLRWLARSSALWLVGLGVAVAASGWLYILRPYTRGLPGPKVRGALPLDVVAGHGAVSLVAFVLVWTAAAVLLGLVARRAGLERLVAAFTLTLCVGAWLYGTYAVAAFIATGVSFREALHIAGSTRVVYLPAAIAGIAGGILGWRRYERRPWVPLAAAAGVALAGVIDIVSAITPEITERLFRLERFVPSAVPRVASAGVAASGVVLLLIARGLARRKRRAWQIAVCLLVASSFLHMMKGLDYLEAVLTGALAVALIARRHDFDAPGDATTRSTVVLRALVIVGAIYAYASLALFVNAAYADRSFSIAFVLTETTHALLGGGFAASPDVHGRFGMWFPLSIALMEMVGVGVVVVSLLAPWRFRPRDSSRVREVARGLVRDWGTDTLSPFSLRADKSTFLSMDERAFLGYTVIAGVALVGGDPIGPPDAVAAVVERFLGYARRRGWTVAFLGASECSLAIAHEFGLHAMYWGDEGIVDPRAFSLEGRTIRKVRQSVHRLARAGYVSDIRSAAEIPLDERKELHVIAQAWRGEKAEHGFAMELDALFGLDGEDELFVIGRDVDGVPRGFLHFVVARAGSALSLSSMPRLSTTPNGFNEWLTCETLAWARDRGFEKVSMNFAAFAALFDPDTKLSRVQRVQRDALLAVRSRLELQLDNLLRFTMKFQPGWQRRYVLYERRADLPRIGVAALTAEGYVRDRGHRSR
jgi:lysyl-tRNA synthetase class 2